ncbi:MAG: archaeal proteasome endopeptidase complex subunit beta [Candidatus Lokiarchaeota archaeon]|nr:archaeal proteasome endopeptidase complex subunit beta [Candidatus Lokiarchaeota archaeon]
MQDDIIKDQFENFLLPGASTVGIKCEDGIVLASEKRLTFGRMILSRSVKKVFRVSDNIGIACAGLVSDFQKLQSIIEAQINIYNLEEGIKIKPKAAAKLVSNILYRNKFFPYFTSTIIGGADEDGVYLFALDPIGSIIEDNFAAAGSGSEISIGVIEKKYDENMTTDNGKELAIQAISAATKRDPSSGEGIDILVVKSSQIEDFHSNII